MVVQKKSDFDWLFGGPKKRRVITPTVVEVEQPEILKKEIKPRPKVTTPFFNPVRINQDTGHTFKYFEDINLKTNELVVNEKIKDYRNDE